MHAFKPCICFSRYHRSTDISETQFQSGKSMNWIQGKQPDIHRSIRCASTLFSPLPYSKLFATNFYRTLSTSLMYKSGIVKCIKTDSCYGQGLSPIHDFCQCDRVGSKNLAQYYSQILSKTEQAKSDFAQRNSDINCMCSNK